MLELIKHRFNQGLDPNLYYFRDQRGHEVDFIFQSARQLVPIEVKAASTFNNGFLKNLDFFEELVGDRCNGGFILYAGEEEQQIGKFHLLHYTNAYKTIG